MRLISLWICARMSFSWADVRFTSGYSGVKSVCSWASFTDSSASCLRSSLMVSEPSAAPTSAPELPLRS